jgi:hypothetical protein
VSRLLGVRAESLLGQSRSCESSATPPSCPRRSG